MMKNCKYNRMSAHKLANKIIKKEEAYLKTDVGALGFEDKCRLLLRNNSTHHPLFKQMDLSELAREVSFELARRAEENDAFSLYCMASIFCEEIPRTDTRLGYLERAVQAGSMEARVQFAGRFLCEEQERDRARHILEETLAIYSLGEVSRESEENLYCCYSMLASCGQTPIDRREYQRLADELALRFALEGNYRAISHLCVSEGQTARERAFWKRVAYLCRSYFYKRGATHLKDVLDSYRSRRTRKLETR